MGLCEECGKHTRQVKIWRTDPDRDPCVVNAKSIMELVLLEARERARVMISVDGEDPEAQCIARRLYGALTSRYGFDLKFDRFESPEGGSPVPFTPNPPVPWTGS